MSTSKKIIAVIGGTGNQGGSVVRALQESRHFHVRALTRNPGKHRELGDEVVEADLSRPETLGVALEGAYGVFAVTNFWETGTDEWAQGKAAVDAARVAGVEHFIWSTLPNVEKISGGAFDVPHFTGVGGDVEPRHFGGERGLLRVARVATVGTVDQNGSSALSARCARAMSS